MVKHSNSNQGKGIEMISNISKFKQDLINKKDKWADEQAQTGNEHATDNLVEET